MYNNNDNLETEFDNRKNPELAIILVQIMDSNEELSIKMEEIDLSLDGLNLDLDNLEINQRKLLAELKMKRVQVEQLRKQEDIQNLEIHHLKGKRKTYNAKISELEFKLEIIKNTCTSYNAQLKNFSTIQLKMQQEKMFIENQSLKELLQKSEVKQRALLRKLEDITSLHELETANRKDMMEQENKMKATIEKILFSFKEIEKDSVKIKDIQEKLQRVKNSQHYINIYKQIAKDAVDKRHEMEKEYLSVKAKLDMLTDLFENYSLPQVAPSDDVESYKEDIKKLQKELNEERDLTIRQNKRLSLEIAQNVTLCLRIDSLESEMNSSKCMKGMCLQTER